jgi:hypothetical protein
MKIIVLFFLIFLFIPSEVLSQCDVNNRTNYSLAISKKGLSRMIAPGATERIPFFDREGKVSFQISWREQGVNKRENIIDLVQDGNLVITDDHLRGKKVSLPETTQHNYLPAPEVISSEYETWLKIRNSSSNIIWIREGILNGLVLRPGQISDSILVSLGMIEWTFLVDLDPVEESSGRNYMQKVVTGLIAKDQNEFVITDRHLNIPSIFWKVTFIFNNESGYDVVGVGSIALGKVIQANSRMKQRKIEANEGFINTAWQYFDDNGVKRQAISEFIVIDGRVLVNIKPSHLQRKFVK